MDASQTDDVIKALSGFELGDKNLVVQRANIGGPEIPSGAPASIPPPPPGLPVAAPAQPTPVLVLYNMVTVQELSSDEDYEDILQDIRDECARHGTVATVLIPRPAAGKTVPGLGKVRALAAPPRPCGTASSYLLTPLRVSAGSCQIFVKFEAASNAAAAAQAIGGRAFNGNTVVTSYLDLAKFDAGDL